MQSQSADTPRFVHLHVHSEFSFLDGASTLERLVRCAAEDGARALALTDHDNLCGAPEFVHLCQTAGLKPILGAELTLSTGHVTVLARTRKGFSSLCRLLTWAHLENERGKPILDEAKLLSYGEDLIVLSGCARSPLAELLRRKRFEQARAWVLAYRSRFGDNFFIELQRTLEPKSQNSHLISLAKDLRIPLIATNNVHYTRVELAEAQDILCCIRHLIRVDEPHEDRKINGELFLKSRQEMAELFADLPEAIENTWEIAARCEDYDISEPRFLPRFAFAGREAAGRQLCSLSFAGAKERYGEITPELKARLDHELAIIIDLGFADYFLVVHDLVQFAKRNRIRHAGRGSAADSAVAYCLDITKVDAFQRNLRFERFINPQRRLNLPDIDIDFDARHRDRVTEYVTGRYGKDHVATVCAFARFRARSAIRDVAKALGFAVTDIDRIAKTMHWATSAKGIRRAIERRPELRALKIPQRKFELLFDLCETINDLPRHISTHLGGVVITGDPIWEISPLQIAAKGVQIVQYDKDGIEDLRLLKLDLLCLRMLGAVEDSVTMIAKRDPVFDYDRIPCDDEPTFELVRSGESAGAFQLESPAQMSLHPRLKTSTYEDVVASVALIRPGPVKGEMVEPFIRRRRGLEKISSIHPTIDKILRHTYGVVLFQEQVVSIAIELAGFSPGQADTLRRTISHHRSEEKMKQLGEIFVAQAVSNGVERQIAQTVFSWLEGYAGYGFCEAHAAAFGDTSYRTAYLLKHYPAEFYAAILNNEPMGYYSEGTIVNEARCRGIQVLGLHIQKSHQDFTVENGAIRVGLKQVKGISESDLTTISERRPFASWGDFLQRASVSRDVIENLVLCGAFDCFQTNRRALLFSLGTYHRNVSQDNFLISSAESVEENIPDFTLYERMSHEWDILGFSPTSHPLQFWRKALANQGVFPNSEIKRIRSTRRLLRAAGWIIRPHTPPTKSGETVVFFSLEDETGLLNITVFPRIYERFGHLIFGQPLVVVEGHKDKRGANSLVANRLWKCPELSI